MNVNFFKSNVQILIDSYRLWIFRFMLFFGYLLFVLVLFPNKRYAYDSLAISLRIRCYISNNCNPSFDLSHLLYDPLLYLFSRIMSLIFPIASPIFIGSAFSALFGALSLIVVFEILNKWRVSLLQAIIFTVTAALMVSFWFHSSLPEVPSLNIFFTLLFIKSLMEEVRKTVDNNDHLVTWATTIKSTFYLFMALVTHLVSILLIFWLLTLILLSYFIYLKSSKLFLIIKNLQKMVIRIVFFVVFLFILFIIILSALHILEFYLSPSSPRSGLLFWLTIPSSLQHLLALIIRGYINLITSISYFPSMTQVIVVLIGVGGYSLTLGGIILFIVFFVLFIFMNIYLLSKKDPFIMLLPLFLIYFIAFCFYDIINNEFWILQTLLVLILFSRVVNLLTVDFSSTKRYNENNVKKTSIFLINLGKEKDVIVSRIFSIIIISLFLFVGFINFTYYIIPSTQTTEQEVFMNLLKDAVSNLPSPIVIVNHQQTMWASYFLHPIKIIELKYIITNLEVLIKMINSTDANVFITNRTFYDVSMKWDGITTSEALDSFQNYFSLETYAEFRYDVVFKLNVKDATIT